MMSDDPGSRDEDLRNRFAALRREEESGAPEFALPSPSGKVPVGRRFVGLAVAVCLVTIGFAVFFLPLVHRKPARDGGEPGISLSQWRPPTDFLLETPSRELLRTVPAIGAWQDYPQVALPKPKHQQAQKEVLR